MITTRYIISQIEKDRIRKLSIYTGGECCSQLMIKGNIKPDDIKDMSALKQLKR